MIPPNKSKPILSHDVILSTSSSQNTLYNMQEIP